jgi:hypothetical protein
MKEDIVDRLLQYFATGGEPVILLVWNWQKR